MAGLDNVSVIMSPSRSEVAALAEARDARIKQYEHEERLIQDIVSRVKWYVERHYEDYRRGDMADQFRQRIGFALTEASEAYDA